MTPAPPGQLWREMLSAQYRQSVLGVLWALIIPLANTAVWLFLTGSRVVQVAETGISYPMFVVTGTLLWSILSASCCS